MIGLPDKIAGRVGRDLAFAPSAVCPLDDVKRQGVEQFGAEGNARQGIGMQVAGFRDEARFFLKSTKCFPLGCLETGQRFGNGVFERGECQRVEPGNCAENVGGQRAVVGAALDDPPARGRAGFLPFAEKPPGEQLAKQRPDTHAGEEIPAASDLARFAGVIAERRLIQGGGHEFRESQRTVPFDPFAQNRPQRRGCGGRVARIASRLRGRPAGR